MCIANGLILKLSQKITFDHNMLYVNTFRENGYFNVHCVTVKHPH